MGRGALVLLLSIGSAIMKVLWVTLVMVLVLAMVAEAKKKPKPKPKGKGKPSKPSKPSKCPADQIKANPKLLKKEFVKYTEMKRGKGGKLEPDATAPCWWDLTKTECAKCKEFHTTSLQTPLEDSRATGTTMTSAVRGACLIGSSARMMPSLKSVAAT